MTDKANYSGMDQNDVEVEYLKKFGAFPFSDYHGANMIEDMRDALVSNRPYSKTANKNRNGLNESY